MPADASPFDAAHPMGAPATRLLPAWKNDLTALRLLALPRHGSSSRTRKRYAELVRAEGLRLRDLASRPFHPARGRIQLLFQG